MLVFVRTSMLLKRTEGYTIKHMCQRSCARPSAKISQNERAENYVSFVGNIVDLIEKALYKASSALAEHSLYNHAV